MAAYLCVASNGVPPSVSKRVLLRVQCEIIIFFPGFIRLCQTRYRLHTFKCIKFASCQSTEHKGLQNVFVFAVGSSQNSSSIIILHKHGVLWYFERNRTNNSDTSHRFFCSRNIFRGLCFTVRTPPPAHAHA